jgi:hypothetical protein
MRLIVRCKSNGWMTNELMRDWLQVVWNRSGVLLRKQGILVLDAFKGH